MSLLPALMDKRGKLRVVKGTGTVNTGAVTIHAPAGVITYSGTLAAGAGAEITLTNSNITTDSVIILTALLTTGTGAATRDSTAVNLVSVSAGSCVFQIYNGDALVSSVTTPKIHFAVL